MLTPTSISNWWNSGYLPPAGRAGELFSANLRQIQAHTDRLFYYLMLIQYAAVITAAAVWSPLAWSGQASSIHFHVWLALIFGGLLASLPVYLICTNPATLLTRQVVAVSQMLTGALLIHLCGGRIETHFHIFGSLAFLAVYRDMRVLATATLVAAIHHLIGGMLIPESVYGSLWPGDWRFLEHLFWMLFEDVFLTLACLQGLAQLSAMASQQAQLEQVNEQIEVAVRTRTQQLSLRTEELGVARDVARESTRLKSQFLANVSHEIRTPMNGVLGMTALLLETDLTQDQRDYATTVQRSAEGLLVIINDILDFSKVEAGKLRLEQIDFALGTEIEDAVQLLAELAEQKRIVLVCEIDGNLPSIVTGDAGRLRQILVNLLGNAIKFTQQGEVCIRASQVERRGSVSHVRFDVSDTGMGITEEMRKKLFEAFVQGDGSTTRKHEGTGLGLAISKQLVHLMGGEIGLNSIVGIGSTFWFEIPMEVVAVSDQADTIHKDALQGLRILVVDDNSTNRMVLQRTIGPWGIRSRQAVEGQQALAAMETAYKSGEPFDIALLDFQMPGMDGLQLAQAIRQRKHLQSTRLIMLTSLGQRSASNSVQLEGIDACMVKPVRRQHLFLMIAKFCGKAAAQPILAGKGNAAKAFPAPARKLSVLVAEDNPTNQRVLSGMLKRLGHRCDVVGDGQSAIEAVEKCDYDIVLMDCQMPGVDGFQAAAAIRRLGGPAGQVPIIAVTANAMTSDRERCLMAGMTGYLSKPLRVGELVMALDTSARHPASVNWSAQTAEQVSNFT